jgi:hypothetical protein
VDTEQLEPPEEVELDVDDELEDEPLFWTVVCTCTEQPPPPEGAPPPVDGCWGSFAKLVPPWRFGRRRMRVRQAADRICLPDRQCDE